MPRIPTYKRQVSPDAVSLPNVRQSANATAASFGGTEARQLGNLGSALGDVAKATNAYSQYQDRLAKYQDEDDAALARDLKTKVERRVLEYFESDVYSRKGKEAFAISDEFKTFMGDLYKESVNTLENENQKSYFKSNFEFLHTSYTGRALTHQLKQKQEFKVQTLDAENQNAIRAAVANQDETSIDDMIFTITANEESKNNGFGKDVKEKAVKEAIHAAHMQIVKAKTVDSPTDAKAHLEKYWDQIDPSTRDNIKEELEEKAEAEWVENQARVLSSLPLDKAIKEVSKIKDDKKRNALSKAVRNNKHEQELLENYALEQRVNKDFDAITKDPFGSKVPLDYPYKEQKYLQDYKNSLMKEKLSAGNRAGAKESDMILYHDLMKMPIHEFKKVDLKPLVNKFKPSDFQKLLARQIKNEEPFSIVTAHRQAEIAIRGITELNDKTPEASERKHNFITVLRSELNAIPEAQRTEEKTNEIIKKLLRPVVVGGKDWIPFNEETFFGFEVPFLDEETASKAMKENIPDNLKSYGTALKHHAPTSRYYVDNAYERRIYDVNGNLIKRLRRK